MPQNTDAQLQKLFKDHGVSFELERGDFLYHEGENPQFLYQLESGLVGLTANTVSGKERLVRLFKAGDFLGHRSIIAGESYHATTKILQKATVKKVSAKAFRDFLSSNPSALWSFAEKMAQDLKRAELALSESTDASVAKRVADSLVYLLEEYPEHLWTKQEIAEYIGSSTPTIFRVLAQFEDQGLIEIKRRQIVIKNRLKLLNFKDF